MSEQDKAKQRLEIAHVLFIDIVDYSKLLTDEQSEALQELNQIVRNTESARDALSANQLTILPTGDGMALVFTGSVEEPADCALEISHALRAQPSLSVRMGIHSGPVHHVKDANQRENIAGVGINIAQRVMDCGDAGHILISKRVADDLAQQRRWQPYLHELGDVEVKHGIVVSLVNLYAETIGNPTPPARFGKARGRIGGSKAGTHRGLSPLARAMFILAGLFIALAIVAVIFTPAILRSLGKGHGQVLPPPPPLPPGPSFGDSIKNDVAKKINDELKNAFAAKKKAEDESGAAGAPDQKSVAVLPFVNLSDEKESEYFSDGVSEELLTVLQKIPGLHVAARTSAFSFKGKNVTAQEIGQKLGVAHLVEGSVRKAGNSVRIAARLSRADTGQELWSENYTRDLKDVFAVQTELAQTIVEQLRGQLSGVEQTTKEKIQAEVQAAEKGGTKNVEAHQYYLQGRFFGYRHSEKDEGQALAAYQRAVELDPNFALAWAGLAWTHMWFSAFSTAVDRAGFDKHLADAREEIARALTIEPNLAEALLARSNIELNFDFNVKAAAETLKKASALAPSNPDVFIIAGNIEQARGDLNRAIESYRRAVALDPVNGQARSFLAFNLILARRFDDARAEYSQVVALNPSMPWAHAGVGFGYLLESKFEEAATVADADAADWTRFLIVSSARWAQKRIPESDAALTKLKGLADMAAYQVAEAYAFRGDRDQAFKWLERARKQRDPGLSSLRKDPFFDKIRDDARWNTFLRAVGLADDQLK